jgi:uncharacterized protein (DUF486 family)
MLNISNVFMAFVWYGHLKIMQEVINFTVLVPFAVYFVLCP